MKTKEKKDYEFADRKTLKSIISNYQKTEEALVNQLYFQTQHGTVIGSFREDIWKQMFRQIIPKKFVIEQSVFIIDSKGRVSNEVDLAIFDETYTPYIFHYGRLKFLPIEAIAAVVECKSTSMNRTTLLNWVERIKALETSQKSYTRTVGKIINGEKDQSVTQTSTRPIRVLCCLNSDYKDIEANKLDFDFTIRAFEQTGLEIEYTQKKDFQCWYRDLNHKGKEKWQETDEKKDKSGCLKGIMLDDLIVKYKYKGQSEKNVSLLTFNFQFNQLLMLINNPIYFPHRAYADLFNDMGREQG